MRDLLPYLLDHVLLATFYVAGLVAVVCGVMGIFIFVMALLQAGYTAYVDGYVLTLIATYCACKMRRLL